MMNEFADGDSKPSGLDMSEIATDGNGVCWNECLEQAAKEIGESSKSYKLMHIEEAQEATNIYNNLMIAGIVTGPLAGIVTSVGAAANLDGNTVIVCDVVIILLGFLSGIFVSILKFGKYDEMSSANKQAAARYTSIESNVRRQLSLYRQDRVAAAPYMEWLETKYDELFMSAPLLPASAYDKFTNKAKELGYHIPNRYDTVIEINNDYEDSKLGEVTDQTKIEVNIDDNTLEPKQQISQGSRFRDAVMMASQAMKGDKKVRRTDTMSQFPQLNECSDQMLQYEMNRMMGFGK